MDNPIATLQDGACVAEIFETAMPGQFTIRYRGQDGTVLAEESLTGVSSYKQREQEIRSRLSKVCQGHEIDEDPLSDAGEY
jgi:hypothetical protein